MWDLPLNTSLNRKFKSPLYFARHDTTPRGLTCNSKSDLLDKIRKCGSYPALLRNNTPIHRIFSSRLSIYFHEK